MSLQGDCSQMPRTTELPTPLLSAFENKSMQVDPPFMPAVSWANFNPESKGGIILKTIYPQPRYLTWRPNSCVLKSWEKECDNNHHLGVFIMWDA